MITALIASTVFAGTGCGVTYAPTVNYGRVATTYNQATTTAYVAPTYHANYTPVYQVSYRAAYAGIPVSNPESQQQLLIIEQQSKTLAKVIDQQQSQIQQLQTERAALLQGGGGGGGDPQPLAAARSTGARVLQTRCAQCHSGAQGERNGWTIPVPVDLANPSWKLRLRVHSAITRPDNPMPKGTKLTDQEMQALMQWASFDPKELVDDPPASAPKKQG